MHRHNLLLALALASGCSESRLPLPGGELPLPDEPPAAPAGASGIYLADADGGNARFLVTGERPAWSPDGLRFAFQRNGQIYSAVADGSQESRLGPGLDPSWSPDGRRLTFAGPEGIAVMGDDGGEVVTILRYDVIGPVGNPAWSPDGSRIAFDRPGDGDVTPDQIFVMNADGSEPRHVTVTRGVLYAESGPAWSPDGNEILFWSYGYGIAAVASGGGTPRSLYQDFRTVAYGANPALAPHGGAVLFTVDRSQIMGSALWLLDGGGHTPRVIIENAMDGVWSPDGSKILFGRITGAH
jgi:Tol biopolymer transport system component